MTPKARNQRPSARGLYDPVHERDACGVGFIAHIKGEASHRLVEDADVMLQRMDHRGACGCEPNTGDGAGMLTALPHAFLARVAQSDLGIELPEPGRYAAGLIFLPTDDARREKARTEVHRIIEEEGQRLLGWRPVPIAPDDADIGPTARAAMPVIEQLFVGSGGEETGDSDPQAAFERRLYLIRKQASAALRGRLGLDGSNGQMFYSCSLSTRVIVYKGMLTPGQLVPFFPDLAEADFMSHLAMVHSRFSTNTFPSWDRAQPNRFMSHNGEINTVRGNMNWMHARQGVAKSRLFGDELEKCFPVVEPDCSDSGSFDNVLEFLLMTGRTLQEAIMMMVPEAWQNHHGMEREKKAFYDFYSHLMEPWDGPASIAFTDGHWIGAVLDRNGLRPSRYYVTDDDLVIMASEVGVVRVAPERVVAKGRLEPGRMFLVDFEEGRIVDDREVKHDFAHRKPYGRWLQQNRVELRKLPASGPIPTLDTETVIPRMRTFGYTTETMQFMLRPLIRERRDPLGSMGNDSALACLSDQPRLVYDYFKQLFAQVTNPPIDAIREAVIMSLECPIGPEGNLCEVEGRHARRLRVPHPVLDNRELQAILQLDGEPWSSTVLDTTWDVALGPAGLEARLEELCREAEAAVDEGAGFLVLSDRAVSAERVPVPSLIACGAVHQHLLKVLKRTRSALVLESGEAREVHHHCLLVGYGADAINPYLAFEALWRGGRTGPAEPNTTDEEIVRRYRTGVKKGMLKVMGKMGISTLQSYKGAQIFEAVGLRDTVIERCFTGTASRLQGVDFEVLAEESLRRHGLGYPPLNERTSLVGNDLANNGEFHWRAGGEKHMWSPPSIALLQHAARSGERDAYFRFARAADSQSTRACTLRGLLRLSCDGRPDNDYLVPPDEVEPAQDIVRRFCTGAMSFGSISAESHETLAIAMNRLGGKSNTGEGGEDPERFKTLPNGDSKRSAIKQVASGRFGVTAWYLTNADELQIKIAQGAKPGEGGELPGHKVDDVIAATRYSTPGVGLISPPPHHDIYSIEDLAQLIHDLKNANREARISVKLVSEVGVGTVAAGVAKAHAEHILISGHDGGTGASPLTSIKHAGLPWELGLAETHQTLVLNDLRSRVVLQTDGQLKTGRDVVIAAMLGAEEFGFSTAPLITLGCIMMRKCHLNTCPVGIATQDKELRRRFAGKPEHVVNYLFMVAEDARIFMARLGVRSIDELVGRVDLIDGKVAEDHWKTDGLDLGALLAPAIPHHEGVLVTHSRAQDHGLELALDHQLIERARPALEHGKKASHEIEISNTCRAVGTMLSNEVMKAHGARGLPDGTIHFRFEGSAGQSFGAFLAPGITLELEGDANDYVGKGLSGGIVTVRPPEESPFLAEENILIGNVALYGATSGEAYFRGRAAERFAVRNSGARAVIEGIGDHGCEYMTGGRIVVLGPTGRNFAAGMSGGIAWVWDPEGRLQSNTNHDMVGLEPVAEEFLPELRRLVERHTAWTGSVLGEQLLAAWRTVLDQFVQVMPTDYRRVLEETRGKNRQAA